LVIVQGPVTLSEKIEYRADVIQTRGLATGVPDLAPDLQSTMVAIQGLVMIPQIIAYRSHVVQARRLSLAVSDLVTDRQGTLVIVHGPPIVSLVKKDPADLIQELPLPILKGKGKLESPFRHLPHLRISALKIKHFAFPAKAIQL
jgi:hypothetical protein